MAKLLVMTDPHLLAPGGRIIDLDPLQQLTEGLMHAAAAHPDADQLIIMGDLTNDGDPLAYEALRNALCDLPWPVTLMMGNHDNRGIFRRMFPEHPVDAEGFIQTITDYQDVRVITLDSLNTAPHTSEAGRLCKSRLAWFRSALNSERPCLVFIHHPPFDTGFVAMDGIALQDRQAFWDVVNGGTVSHVFAGHVHRTITARIGGNSVTIFKSLCHQIPMLLGKDGFGSPIAEPGAYGIVVTRGDDVVVHFEDVLPAA